MRCAQKVTSRGKVKKVLQMIDLQGFFCKFVIAGFISRLPLNFQSDSRKMMTEDYVDAIMFAYRYGI